MEPPTPCKHPHPLVGVIPCKQFPGKMIDPVLGQSEAVAPAARHRRTSSCGYVKKVKKKKTHIGKRRKKSCLAPVNVV